MQVHIQVIVWMYTCTHLQARALIQRTFKCLPNLVGVLKAKAALRKLFLALRSLN